MIIIIAAMVRKVEQLVKGHVIICLLWYLYCFKHNNTNQYY